MGRARHIGRLAQLEDRVADLEQLLFTHEHMTTGTSIFPGRRRPHWVQPDGTLVIMEEVPPEEPTTP